MALAFAREGCERLVLTSLDTTEEKQDMAAIVAAIEEQGGAKGERGTTKVAALSGDLVDENFRVAVVEAAGGKLGARVLIFLSSLLVAVAAACASAVLNLTPRKSQKKNFIFFPKKKLKKKKSS